MIKSKSSRFLYIALLVLAGCSIDPIARIDFSGLGDSIVGKRVKNSIFLGADATERYIGQLVNTQDILSQSNPRSLLESMGFSCDLQPKKMCFYDGTAKFSQSMPDGANPVSGTTRVHIRVDTSTTPFKVITEVETSKH